HWPDAEAGVVEVQPSAVLQEVDAVPVLVIPRPTPEAVAGFVPVHQGDGSRDRKRCIVVVELARRLGRVRLIQPTVFDHEGAPEHVAVGLLGPVHQETATVNKPSLAVGHLLEELIPAATHPPVALEHLPDVILSNTVAQPGVWQTPDDRVADLLLVVEPAGP